jgi:hypothetical protein
MAASASSTFGRTRSQLPPLSSVNTWPLRSRPRQTPPRGDPDRRGPPRIAGCSRRPAINEAPSFVTPPSLRVLGYLRCSLAEQDLSGSH